MTRILALDLDGTTVDDAGVMKEPTIEALGRARKAGHLVCFVTGRREIDNITIHDRCLMLADYLLFNTGGKLIRTNDGAVLFNQFMRADDAADLIAHCLLHDYQLHLVSGMYWAVNRWSERLQNYADRIGTRPSLYRCLDQVPHSELEGMMATSDALPISAHVDAAGLAIDYVDSEPGCIDLLPTGVTKWGGIERLLGLLDMAPQQVIAVGDYDSDISMLRGAGVGVAVANARPSAKAAADYVTTADNNHNAVVDVIDDLLLGLRPGLCRPRAAP